MELNGEMKGLHRRDTLKPGRSALLLAQGAALGAYFAFFAGVPTVVPATRPLILGMLRPPVRFVLDLFVCGPEADMSPPWDAMELERFSPFCILCLLILAAFSAAITMVFQRIRQRARFSWWLVLPPVVAIASAAILFNPHDSLREFAYVVLRLSFSLSAIASGVLVSLFCLLYWLCFEGALRWLRTHDSEHGPTPGKRIAICAVWLITPSLCAAVGFQSAFGLRQAIKEFRVLTALSKAFYLDLLLFAHGMDPAWQSSFPLPMPQSSGSLASSTDYFRWLVGSNLIGERRCGDWCGRFEDFSCFALPGIQEYRGRNPDQFRAENNAWCIVADLAYGEALYAGAPVLLTRNVRIRSLADYHEGVLADEPPFGTNAAVIVHAGSAIRVMDGGRLAAYLAGLNMTNRVLRP